MDSCKDFPFIGAFVRLVFSPDDIDPLPESDVGKFGRLVYIPEDYSGKNNYPYLVEFVPKGANSGRHTQRTHVSLIEMEYIPNPSPEDIAPWLLEEIVK